MASAIRGEPAVSRLATLFRFVMASGFAALLNFSTRIVLSEFMLYSGAIVVAFFVGMTTAFLLNRRFVFQTASQQLSWQVGWFVLINLLALVQTLAVSLLLAWQILPMLGVAWHNEEIAHAVGIVVPIITSYFAHKLITFR
jgi:putative flippase GtrA